MCASQEPRTEEIARYVALHVAIDAWNNWR